MDVALSNVCDKSAEATRNGSHQGESESFVFDQKCGITMDGVRIHGSPRESILMVSHDKDLQEYICEKDSWKSETFDKV